MHWHYIARALVLCLCSFPMLMIAQSYLSHKAAGASSYYVASLDMVIDPGAEDFVVTAINDARSVGANHFVLVMNTNGGACRNIEKIINAISDYENAGNNFTTLIAPVSRHAFSAGAFIAEASDQIWMVSGTTIAST